MSKLMFVLLLLFSVDPAFSQNVATSFFQVEGEVLNPLKLSVDGLGKLKTITLNAKDKDGKDHLYKGVALSDILDSAGVTLGSQLKGESLKKFVLIEASDGYEVIFALPEVDPEFSHDMVLIAYQVDGKPLQPHEGSFRLVVPGDKKHARWIRQIKTIKVQFSR